MITRIISIGFLLFGLFVQANAQQGSTPRTISPADNLAIQKGELKSFEGLLYRFNTAVEDDDLENMKTIMANAMQFMKAECAQTANNLSNQKEQLKLVKEVEKLISGKKGDELSNFKQAGERLNSFSKLMAIEIDGLVQTTNH